MLVVWLPDVEYFSISVLLWDLGFSETAWLNKRYSACTVRSKTSPSSHEWESDLRLFGPYFTWHHSVCGFLEIAKRIKYYDTNKSYYWIILSTIQFFFLNETTTSCFGYHDGETGQASCWAEFHCIWSMSQCVRNITGVYISLKSLTGVCCLRVWFHVVWWTGECVLVMGRTGLGPVLPCSKVQGRSGQYFYITVCLRSTEHCWLNSASDLWPLYHAVIWPGWKNVGSSGLCLF